MRLIYFIFVLVFSAAHAMSKPSFSKENIGVHTIQYNDPKRERPIVVEVWYPTQEQGPFDEAEDLVWVHPKEIRDVLPSQGKHPLIIMSHGHGGDRRDRSWLVEYLIDSGYIVASVEHHGNSWRSYNSLLTLRFWDRAKDISFAITKLIKEPFLRKKIDRNRIGFIGYSMGGMTGLALAGAKAQNVKEIVKKLQSSYQEIDPELVEQIDFEEAHQSFFDRRIKAMVLLSPAAYIFSPSAFKNIKVPVALVASEGDEILPFKEHALKVIQYLKGAKLKLLKDKVSHYVFLNRVSDTHKNMIREEIQTEEIQADRMKFHKEVGNFVKAFFKEHL